MSDPVTIQIVDDDDAIRQSIGFLLRKAGYTVESHASGASFLKGVTRDARGCVLLDVRMPDIDGLEVQEALSQRGVPLPVIMLTGHGEVVLAVRAIKAGAIDFLEKPFERSVLLTAVEAALDYSAKGENDQIVAADAKVRIAALTAREQEVLDGLAHGRPNKVIAFDLGISTRTVEVHRANLMAKLSARSLSQVLRIAFVADRP